MDGLHVAVGPKRGFGVKRYEIEGKGGREGGREGGLSELEFIY